MITNLDVVILRTIVSAGLAAYAVQLIAKVPVLYQTYGSILNCLNYASVSYIIATTMTMLFASMAAFFLILVTSGLVMSAAADFVNHLPFLAMHTSSIQPSIPQDLISEYRQLVGLPFFMLVVCVAAPIVEETLFRYLPAVKPRNNKKFSGGPRQHAVSPNEQFYYAAISLLFGGAHITNHIGLGAKLADISVQSMQSATCQCVTSFLFASSTLVPVFRRRGLPAAIAAHMAWNSSVMLLMLLANLDQWTAISAAVLAVLSRLAYQLVWAMTKQGKEY